MTKENSSNKDYHTEWRKKNPKKYALTQFNYWRRKLTELEQEEKKQ